MLNQFLRDPVANSIAVITLIFMLASVIWVTIRFIDGDPNKAKTWPSWVIPVLSLFGLVIAIYLSFIESNQSEAFCGTGWRRIRSARIVLGAVAPVPMRAMGAEKTLIGESPSQPLFTKAGETAAGESKPIDDHRGTAGYRRDMVSVLTRKTLQAGLERANSNKRE